MASAIDRTAVPQACARVQRANGVQLGKGFGASSNSARWTALKEAIASLTAGDVLDLGPGTFAAAGENMPALPAGCKLRGAGIGKTIITTTSDDYCFITPVDDCEYSDFTVIQNDPTPEIPQGSAFGLPPENTSDCTGWVCRRVRFEGNIDGPFFGGSGNYTLQGKFISCESSSGWDAFRVNNLAQTDIDLEFIDCDFKAEAVEGVREAEAVATGLSFNIGGGEVRVSGGRFRGLAGHNSSFGVLNEGTGGDIYLTGGVIIETTAPVTGDEYHIRALSAPIYVGSAVKHDTSKVAGSVVYESSETRKAFVGGLGTVAEVNGRLEQRYNPQLVDPLSAASTLISSGGTYGAASAPVVYRVYAYKTIDSVKYYSASYVESNSVSPTNPGIRTIELAITTDGTEDGIRILRNSASGGYVNYKDVAGDGSGVYAVTDTSAGWTAGSTVTPVYDERLGLNYKTGGTLYGYHGPNLPIWASSVIAPKTVELLLVPSSTSLSTGDGKGGVFFRVPSEMNGWNLTGVALAVNTASSSGLPTFQVRRVRSGSSADMLTTKVSCDANEVDSKDAATPAVIDTSNDDVNTGDQIYGDCDIAGTGTMGASLSLTFTKPTS